MSRSIHHFRTISIAFKDKSRLLTGLLSTVLLVGGILLLVESAYGDQQLLERSLQMSSSQVSASASYKLSFTLPNPGALGSIQAQFCANDPFIDAPCTAPAGFDIAHATLDSQTGETGFSVASSTTANVLVLTRTATAALAQPVSYELSGVINPSATGSYFVRVQTYASTDASGSDTNYGGLAFDIGNVLSISAEVPPYLTFCTGITISAFDCSSASGDYINFGTLSAGSAAQGASQLLVATNAANGYGIFSDGTTLTSGNNVIAALASRDISRPGTAQFGINLRANVAPNIGLDPSGPGFGQPSADYNTPNFYQFVPGDILASSSGADDYRKYTVSYIVNVPQSQPPGVYVSTVTYICLANF